MNKFQLWYDQLWALRHEIGHDRYPIPDRKKSLRFALTEIAGEANDADLERTGEWVRNNPDHKHKDPYRELAQGAMMLMLALGEGHTWSGQRYALDPITLDDLMLDMAALNWGCSTNESHLDTWEIECLVEGIDIYCIGLDSHIEAEMQRLRDKWLPTGGE